MLILAGISIASLIGNGLFEKAKLAKEKQENAQIEENDKLSKYEDEIEKNINNTRDSFGQKDLLWSGKYNTSVSSNSKQTTGGCLLNEGYNIEEYSFILILCVSNNTDTMPPNYYSSLFPVDVIKANYGYPTCEVGIYAVDGTYSRMDLGFINGNTFYVAWKNLSGWGNQYVSHIYGIK